MVSDTTNRPPTGSPHERPEVLERVATALGQPVVRWERPECGLSAAERWITGLADGSSVFVKAATDPETTGWLANERDALLVAGDRFGPAVVGWLDDQPAPILITEDLCNGYWPAGTGSTHWRAGDIDAVLSDLDLLRTMPAGDLDQVPEPSRHWENLLADGRLSRAGLCTSKWIAANGPALVAADDLELPADQMILVHGDVRSDNLCVLPNGQVRFVDWSQAGAGHPLSDLVMLLPTLRLEGGPEPATVITEPAELITRAAGSTLARATGELNGPEWLRQVMIQLAAISFRWACDALQLAPPDGSRFG
jgi:hypothetical protein